MKWIDMLKHKFKNNNYVVRDSEVYTVKYDKFEYDVSVSKDDVQIFLDQSDIGYSFKIKDEKVIWEHPNNAQCFYSDEVISEIENCVRDFFEKK